MSLSRLARKKNVQFVLRPLLKLLFRVEMRGLENLEAAGASALIASNHQSYLDGLLFGVFMPGDPVFAIDPIAAAQWWAKPVLSVVEIDTLNPKQPLSVRHLIQTLKSGRHCVIFPEGRLTETGTLMKISAGAAMIAEKADVPVVPVRMDGPQYSPFGFMRGRLPIQWFPKIVIHFLPPQRLKSTDHLSGNERRDAMSRNLYDIMAQTVLATQTKHRTLWHALVAARNRHGGGRAIIEDERHTPVTYNNLITSSYLRGASLARKTKLTDHIGLMLPTGIASVETFFALQSIGRVPVLLDFDSGLASVLAAIETTRITTIVTSRAYVESEKLADLVARIETKIRMIYLEDLDAEHGKSDRFIAAFKTRFGWTSHDLDGVGPVDAAAILVTSDSGNPKGVSLSHRNITSNIDQIRTVLAYTPIDIFFNALPIYRAFSLTCGVLAPILHGAKIFLYAKPQDYRMLPELIYHANTTILLATDTHLNGYAKTASNYDLYCARLILTEGERLKPETAQLYSDRFGVPVFEGYGATECSPMVSVNTPIYHRRSTAGRLLPGIESRLDPIAGIDNGARLWVKGPNVALGHYKADRPGVLSALADGWYDTGDTVRIDDDGFLTILTGSQLQAAIN